jgi:hypothetical protein
MVAVRTSETSVENNFTRQYIPEDSSEHHTNTCACGTSYMGVWLSDLDLRDEWITRESEEKALYYAHWNGAGS